MSELLIGDVRDVLPTLGSESVQMCVTSPPYWGLRDYGVDGQLGLEQTPEEYVVNMVAVFREVRRVLKADGTCWVNMGDSYTVGHSDWSRWQGGQTLKEQRREKLHTGLKPKDLIGMPWRLAFALQADGWYLRQDIVWHKLNPMPESVTDRCTKAHEYVFLLSKSARYYFDAEAIRENKDAKPDIRARASTFRKASNTGTHGKGADQLSIIGRNKRSVWTVASQAYSEAHFATFPEKLIEPCILAGSRPGDVVLDPFFGSGTTGQVCERLGRQWLGVELNAEYAEMAQRRTAQIGLGL